MRRIGLAAGLAALLSVVLLAGGASQGAAAGKRAKLPASFYGVVPNTSLDAGDYTRMRQAHVGTIRFGVNWQSIQGSAGAPYDFSQTDAAVAGAASKGIGLLPILFGAPSFANPGCSGPDCYREVPTSKSALKAWGALLRALVQRYGPKGMFPKDPITTWQIWNEQNNPVEKTSAKEFAKFLKTSAKAIHSVDPKAKIMLGGMFGQPPAGGSTLAWNYLTALYKAGAKKFFDAVALHPYAPKLSGISSQILHIRKVMKKFHDTSTPTYITEIGWGSSKKTHGGTGGRGAAFNVGIKKQKANLKASFGLLTNNRAKWKIGGVDWFTWKDPLNPPDGLCAFCYSSGLYKANGTSAKPALGAFKAFAKKAG